jgi:hypothetical protein
MGLSGIRAKARAILAILSILSRVACDDLSGVLLDNWITIEMAMAAWCAEGLASSTVLAGVFQL